MIFSKLLTQEFQWPWVFLAGNPKALRKIFLIWAHLGPVFSFYTGLREWERKWFNNIKNLIYPPKLLPHPLHTAVLSLSTFPAAFWAHHPDLSMETKDIELLPEKVFPKVHKNSGQSKIKSQAYFFLLKMEGIYSCQRASSVCL